MRAEKQLLLDEIKEKIEGTQTFLVTRYEKLNAKAEGNFRKAVREAGGDFEVVRKRMLMKAAEGIGIEIDEGLLDGHIGIVLAYKDPVATTKVVFNTSKETEGAVSVIGARFEGEMYTASQVERISKLPDLDTLRAQFLGLMEAPMAQTLAVMESLLCSLPHLLENKAKI